jgi:hypothetical protein
MNMASINSANVAEHPVPRTLPDGGTVGIARPDAMGGINHPVTGPAGTPSASVPMDPSPLGMPVSRGRMPDVSDLPPTVRWIR